MIRLRNILLGAILASAAGCVPPELTPEQRKALPAYFIVNTEERAAHNPDFEIPSREKRQSRKVGDMVKLILQVPPGAPPRNYTSERPWFVIKAVLDGPRYVGSLDNEPVVFTELKIEDLLEFGPENIFQILEDAPKK